MAGAHCEQFPNCMNVGENATVPKCEKPDCPGRKTWLHIFQPNQCNKHQWDGPMIEIPDGTSVTCSKCGTDAYTYWLRSHP